MSADQPTDGPKKRDRTKRVQLRLRDGHYYLRWRVGQKFHEESAKTTNARQAEAARAKKQTELYEGRVFPDRKRGALTMEGLADLWLAHAKFRGKKSIADDAERLARVVAILGPTTSVSTLTHADVTRLVTKLLASPRRGKAAKVNAAREKPRTLAPATATRSPPTSRCPT